jgi:hypothetical protein
MMDFATAGLIIVYILWALKIMLFLFRLRPHNFPKEKREKKRLKKPKKKKKRKPV